jgi:hypothetical protein
LISTAAVVVVVEAAAGARAVGLSPSQDLDHSAGSRFVADYPALRGGTLTELDSLVITEQNATILPR